MPEGKEIAHLVRQLEQAMQAADLALSERDHAILTILYIRRRLHLPSIKKARELALSTGGTGVVPSEATISQQRKRLNVLLHQIAPPHIAHHDDPVAVLRAVIGEQSFPAFCAQLRRDHGLLWDPIHLQRALHPTHRHPLSTPILTMVLRRVAPGRQDDEDIPEPSMSLTQRAALQRFTNALAYERRLPGEPGMFSLHLWRLTAGDSTDVDVLAERVRAWVRQQIERDPVSLSWTVDTMLAMAWAAVTRAQALRQAVPRQNAEQPTPTWSDLPLHEQRIVATKAALPGRAWTEAELNTIATGTRRSDARLALLVEGGWLARVRAPDRHPTYICPPAAYRAIAPRPETDLPALEGLANLWRYLLIPRVQKKYTPRRPFKTLVLLFEEYMGEPLVHDCLDLVAHATSEERVRQSRGQTLRAAGELLRWMWRVLSDILGPSGQVSLHVRLVTLADAILSQLPPDDARHDDVSHKEWAGVAAEHALIVIEGAFVTWQLRQTEASRHALIRGGGALPALEGGLLPPLAQILTREGAERECLLTGRLGLIEYNILIARDHLEALLRLDAAPLAQVRILTGAQGILRRHLAALEREETADEERKGLDPHERWNYPALGRWDSGRPPAHYHYWASYSLIAEARGTRLFDPRATTVLLHEARAKAARATDAYTQAAQQNAKWDRVVYALLNQGEIEREDGRWIAAAMWNIQATVGAVEWALEGETAHLAMVCQTHAAVALARVNDAIGRGLAPAPEEVHILLTAMSAFIAARRTCPDAEIELWADIVSERDDINLNESHLLPTRLRIIVQSWEKAFLRAVKTIALAQSVEMRTQFQEYLQQIAPDVAADLRLDAPSYRHRGT
jgi:hypothetical protein